VDEQRSDQNDRAGNARNHKANKAKTGFVGHRIIPGFILWVSPSGHLSTDNFDSTRSFPKYFVICFAAVTVRLARSDSLQTGRRPPGLSGHSFLSLILPFWFGFAKAASAVAV
jgi:hypothetical protein